MKIIYVAMKYDYGNPKRGEDVLRQGFYNALKKVKVGKENTEVIFFPYDEILISKGRERMNQDILELVLKEKPKIVFFGLENEFIKKETVKKISQQKGVITINWNSDDNWKFHTYSKHWAFLYHYVITTDYNSLKKYHQIGYKNVILSQWGYDPLLYKPLDLPKIYDISFVGTAHGRRKKIIERIKKKKKDFNLKCWGKGWDNGRVSFQEMIRIFNQSKINLNFTKSSGVFWKDFALIFLKRDYQRRIRLTNPKYYLDNFKTMIASLWTNQVKARIFEIPACRTFLLTEYVDHLEDYYKIGYEIDCFRDEKELIQKIEYYLKNEKKREEIAEAGYKRTIQNHTWEKRVREILKKII